MGKDKTECGICEKDLEKCECKILCEKCGSALNEAERVLGREEGYFLCVYCQRNLT